MLFFVLLVVIASLAAAQEPLKDAPKDAPKDASKDTPKDAPKDTPKDAPADAPKCALVHMIVARGSSEPPGYGASISLSTAVQAALPGTTSEALDYPARMPYQDSMANGTATLKAVIARHVANCPDSKVVLIGYSQGGAVSLDALCGGGGHPEIGPPTEGLTKEEGKNVKAVAAFGDPRFVKGMAYNVGTNNKTSGVS